MGTFTAPVPATHRRIIVDKQTEAEITKEAARLGYKVCFFRGLLLKRGLTAMQQEKGDADA